MSFSPDFERLVEHLRLSLTPGATQEMRQRIEAFNNAKAVAELAVAQELPLNVRAEFRDGELQGWRLSKGNLGGQGPWDPGDPGLRGEDTIPGHYTRVDIGTVESVLDPQGDLWVFPHTSYLPGDIELDARRVIPHERVYPVFLGRLSVNIPEPVWLKARSSWDYPYSSLNLPFHIQNHLASLVVRHNLR